jgi:Ring finger domain
MKIPFVLLLATSFFLLLPLMCFLSILVRFSLYGSVLNQSQVRHVLTSLIDSVLFSCRQPVLFEKNAYVSEIKLDVIKYERKIDNADNDEAVECVLCMYEIEEGEEMRDLRCKHLFHKRCLDRWLVKKLTCPLCRDCLS